MTEPPADPDLNPREPEIEFLGKIARGALFCGRVVLFVAGVVAILYGLKRTLTTGTSWPPGGYEWRDSLSASGAVWLTLGLPLALPADVMLRRSMRQVALLGVSVALWFLPITLGDDSDYGYILRIFATLVAFLSLAVWRTLWRLGDTGLPR